MGTMSKKISDMQARRVAYQEKKTKEYMANFASYLSSEERIVFFGGGFVEIPEQERKREKIDVYPYLIP